jgi:hypothetical protein
MNQLVPFRCVDASPILVARRRKQLRAYAAAAQPALFKLTDDRRPASRRTAAGRYHEPMLFDR